jgi:16S rRNA (guanine966-N2)-methyltransferase
MRIIAGSLRGRSFSARSLANVRPTTDRARETVFNIVQNYVEYDGLRVLDLCAGSGALGLEAISRGAAHCVFVEKHRPTAEALAATAREFGVADCVEIIRQDMLKVLPTLEGQVFDLLFCDPPYALRLLNTVFSSIQRHGLAAPGALFVAEHEPGETVLVVPGWEKRTERSFGGTKVDFFQYSTEVV